MICDRCVSLAFPNFGAYKVTGHRYTFPTIELKISFGMKLEITIPGLVWNSFFQKDSFKEH